MVLISVGVILKLIGTENFIRSVEIIPSVSAESAGLRLTLGFVQWPVRIKYHRQNIGRQHIGLARPIMNIIFKKYFWSPVGISHPAFRNSDWPLHKALPVSCNELEQYFSGKSPLIRAALWSGFYSCWKSVRSFWGREGWKNHSELWKMRAIRSGFKIMSLSLQLTLGFVQWPSEHMLINRIKPSDISGCHGLFEIWSKKRTITPEGALAAQL